MIKSVIGLTEGVMQRRKTEYWLSVNCGVLIADSGDSVFKFSFIYIYRGGGVRVFSLYNAIYDQFYYIWSIVFNNLENNTWAFSMQSTKMIPNIIV